MSEETITQEAPAERATKADWVAYAVTRGLTEDHANSLTKDALMALLATAGNGEAVTEDNGEQGSAPATEAAKPKRAKAPDTSGIKPEDINAAVLLEELFEESAPTRARSDEQALMDAVVQRAYDRWVKERRPSLWQKMPVITYFLTAEEVRAYRYLITNGAKVAKVNGDAPGVTIRFGNEFTLSEKQAERINRPDDVGKIVLSWAAIDKQKRSKSPATVAAENRAEREAVEGSSEEGQDSGEQGK